MGEIVFSNVTFGYGKRNILRDLSVRFDSARITLLTGATGCGKSTLLYLAAGIYPENAGMLRSGAVAVDGEDPAALSPVLRCRRIGMMFQNPALQFCMDTVENELAFCLENLQTPQEDMDALIDEALRFCEIAHLRERALLSLSGGEQQMAMLACLVVLSPAWILLDEPFANLDDDSARAIAQKLLLLHKERGTGILAVDHRLENWLDIAEKIQVMDARGGLVAEEVGLSQTELKRLAEWNVNVPGDPYQAQRPNKSPAAAPVLQLRGLSVHYEGEPVLAGLDADFYPGRIYAILGASGSGKTTLFDALRGLVRYGGIVLYRGRPLGRRAAGLPGRIGFVVQNPQDQFVGDTVYDEVFISLRQKRQGRNPAQETEKILRGIGLWSYRKASPYTLSQGQQRRLGVAALLAYDCDLLICDEPTYAQDRSNTFSIMDALQEAVLTRRVTVIFSTHDRQLARDYADVQCVLEGGVLHQID